MVWHKIIFFAWLTSFYLSFSIHVTHLALIFFSFCSKFSHSSWQVQMIFLTGIKLLSLLRIIIDICAFLNPIFFLLFETQAAEYLSDDPLILDSSQWIQNYFEGASKVEYTALPRSYATPSYAIFAATLFWIGSKKIRVKLF